jgi:hypothetical protein
VAPPFTALFSQLILALAAGTPILRDNEELSISYLPILPPLWAAIPTDLPIYPRPLPVRSPTPLFSLEKMSSCLCSTLHQSAYSTERPSFIREGTLYTAFQAFPCRVELQACPNRPKSRNHFIGPDLREIGVFNFNNSTFVSHELLDEYTSAYASSETPFDSWAEFLNRRYILSGSTFMGKDLFRSCWFAYARLQKLDGDFQCPHCGDHPDNVIWDGVTLAFHRKQLRSTIQPPTATSDNSQSRPTKYVPSQHALPSPALRKLLRSLLKQDQKNPNNSIAEKPDLVAAASSQLSDIHTGLGEMFAEYIPASLSQSKEQAVPSPIRNFFLQVHFQLLFFARPS